MAGTLKGFFKNIILKQFDINPTKYTQGINNTYTTNAQAYKDYINGYPNEILQLYLEFDDQDRNSVDIKRFLDNVSESATLKNKEINATIWVESDNATIKEKANKLIRRLQLDKQAKAICRNIGKYGRWVVKPIYSDENPKRIVSIIDKDYDGFTWQYQYDDLFLRTVQTVYEQGSWVGFKYQGQDYAPWDFVEFKLGSSLFGESFMFEWYTHYRSLDLIERSLELYRVCKSPQLNIYKVPMATSDPVEQINILKMYESYTESQTRKSNTQDGIDKNAQPPSPLMNMYFPQMEAGIGGVEVINNDADINAIADIVYKRNKFLLMMGMPLDENMDTTKYLTQTNIQVLGKVEALQEAFMEGVDRLIQIEFALLNIPVTEDSYILKMSKSSDLDEIARLEKIQLAADVSANLFQVGQELNVDQDMWRRFVLEQVLGTYYGDIIQGYENYKQDNNRNKSKYHESIKKQSFIEWYPHKKGKNIPANMDVKNY